MRRPWRAGAIGVVLLAGCGAHARPVAQSCVGRGDGREILAALQRAPARVALADGTRLSDCIASATEGSDLENVGGVFTRAGSVLADRAQRDPAAALRLGYLVGAVERGSRSTAGFQAELENRMRSYTEDPGLRGAEQEAMRRGRAAGRRSG